MCAGAQVGPPLVLSGESATKKLGFRRNIRGNSVSAGFAEEEELS